MNQSNDAFTSRKLV